MASEPATIELANPLSPGAASTLLPQPCVLVIFGAAGDLSWRKLMPAVYNLNVDGVLPSNFAVVGFGLVVVRVVRHLGTATAGVARRPYRKRSRLQQRRRRRAAGRRWHA